MNYKNILLISIMISATGLFGYYLYTVFFAEKEKSLYSTEKVQKRTLTQVIKTTGYLETEDEMKIGSLIVGIVHKMHVEENQDVKKGQLLVEIDDGKADTEVREAAADLKKSESIFTYQKAFYARQKALYKNNHISTNDFELATQNYEQAKYEVELKKATLAKATLEFNNKKITAPDDGIVIEKIAAEGETVTIASPPTLLYILAKDITKMIATLEIDESVIGNLKPNMQAILTFDTYPHKIFTGTVTEIKNAPQKTNGSVSYLATIPLDNSQRLFRPGMTVDSRITVAQKKDVLAVPGHIFKLNRTMINNIAKIKKLAIKPLDEETRNKLSLQDNMKTIWLFKDNTFIEQPVKVGIHDNAFFEIVSGLDGTETLVIDTVEPDVMKKFFERFFGKGLS